jgi:hypothetical protein
MAKDYVSRETFNITIKDFETQLLDKDKQIRELKSNQSKVVWTILTIFIVAVAGLVIKTNS